jgi:hypothetical protein
VARPVVLPTDAEGPVHISRHWLDLVRASRVLREIWRLRIDRRDAMWPEIVRLMQERIVPNAQGEVSERPPRSWDALIQRKSV